MEDKIVDAINEFQLSKASNNDNITPDMLKHM